MKRTLQVHEVITVNVSRERLWALISDSASVGEWAPMVTGVPDYPDVEELGAERTCTISMGGKSGYIKERIVEFDPPNRIAVWVFEDDLGYNKLVRDYRVRIRLDRQGPDKTDVFIEAYYEPKGMLGAVMQAVMLKRMVGKALRLLLTGMKEVAEGRSGAQNADVQVAPLAS